MTHSLFRFRYWMGIPEHERAADTTAIAKNSAVGHAERCIAAAYISGTGWRQCEKYGSEASQGLCSWHAQKMGALSSDDFLVAANEAVRVVRETCEK
jgi:hypothetical protein